MCDACCVGHLPCSRRALIAQVLYILTVVTTVFIPAQFLTGLYGMNFAVMPELTWEYVVGLPQTGRNRATDLVCACVGPEATPTSSSGSSASRSCLSWPSYSPSCGCSPCKREGEARGETAAHLSRRILATVARPLARDGGLQNVLR